MVFTKGKKFFRFFFGEQPILSDVLIILVLPLVIGLFIAFEIPIVHDATTTLQKIIIVIISYDVLGGIISGFTESTHRFYDEHTKFRWVFYAFHVIQPLILFILFWASPIFFFFCWLYPVAGAILCRELIPSPIDRAIRGILIIIGVIVYTYFVPKPFGMEWFGYAFMVKLIIGFGLPYQPSKQPQ